MEQFISLNCNNFTNCNIDYSVNAAPEPSNPAVECLDTNEDRTSRADCITLNGWAWNDVIGWISFGKQTTKRRRSFKF